MDARLGGFANYSAEQLAAFTFSSVRTARRWKLTDRVSPLVHAWLELTHYGKLGPISRQWEDWRLYRGELHAPNGWSFSPAQLLVLPHTFLELRDLRRAATPRPREPTQLALAIA